MKSYCLKCRKYTKNINVRVSNSSNGKTMILSECEVCGSKKSRSKKIIKKPYVIIMSPKNFQSESTLYSLPECEETPSSKQVSYLKFN